MNVVVSRSGAALTGAADLTSFDVRVDGADEDAFTAVLQRERVGTFVPGPAFPGGHVHVRVEWLRAAAGAHDLPADWAESFAGMLAYAERKGWTSPDGATVRGHVVTGAGTGER
ncbi:hypothetical protein [Kineococcus auxinigenes]|uniref:hypothetical protein n=1 Tax=unclassified Kineococcus TaxID=2621656 RepID=UPI003D7E5FE1